jgi:hypothetical protein
MLDAFTEQGLHRIPMPNFTYNLRAGIYNDWSIRLAWRGDAEGARVNVFIHASETGTTTWSVDVTMHSAGSRMQDSGDQPTLQAAQAAVGGIDILAMFGQ